ncbi:MAG: PIN domain-containing protein [Dermatophilaceae bacterium]
MFYLDTSALVNLVGREPESAALAEWLTGREQELVSSVLVEVELPRAVRRTGPGRLAAAPPLLGRARTRRDRPRGENHGSLL